MDETNEEQNNCLDGGLMNWGGVNIFAVGPGSYNPFYHTPDENASGHSERREYAPLMNGMPRNSLQPNSVLQSYTPQ